MECEAREWLKRRTKQKDGKAWLVARLASIEKRRGKKAADALRAAIKVEWEKK